MPGAFIRRSRHGTVFHFRRRVPRQLQAMLGRTHINASMGTIDRREALVRARRLAVDTDRVFAELHRMANPKRPSSSPVITVGLVYKFGQVHIRTEPHDSEADREKAHELARELASRVGPNQAQPAPAIDPVTQPGKSLGDAVDEFLAGIAKPKTFRTYRTALKRKAIPYFGADTPVSTIDQTWFARYVREIFADPKGAHNTKQGYINAFTSMFSMLRAMDPHGTAALTTKRLIPPNPTPDDEQRDAFSFDDLRVLLANACRFKRTEPHKYWVTVASTFMGGRIEELAQAELAADLRQEPQSGRWFLDVNERVDRDGVKRKSRKKDASRRSLPIHSALQKRGLVQYLLQQREQGLRPFEAGWKGWNEPDRGHVHWSHYIVRWGGRELEKLEQDRKLIRAGRSLGYFHSMRHTFASELAERGLSEQQIAALQGQRAGAGENANRYQKLRQNPRVLIELVEAHMGRYVALLDEIDPLPTGTPTGDHAVQEQSTAG